MLSDPIPSLRPAAATPVPAGSRPAERSPRILVWISLAVGIAMFAYSWRGDHYLYVADDAGITLRYAERMAEGRGFNYNDGEAVNGASNPVYVLVEAALLRLGLTPEVTILAIASACLAAGAAVLFFTFARFYSLPAAAFSVLALIAYEDPFESISDGMEAPIITLLAALLFLALHRPGSIFVGIVLGALVASKLDGALASISFTLVYVAARRSFPWRTAAIAVLAAAPVFCLLFVSFGSIVPNSMLIKIGSHSLYWKLDHLWMHKYLIMRKFALLYWGAWASIAWLAFARELERSRPIAVLQGWFLLHMLAFATVNLGAPYTWYAAAPIALSVILCSFLVHLLATAVLARGGRLTWDPARLPMRAWPVGLLLVAALAAARQRVIRARLDEVKPPHALWISACGDLGRQAAGAWLRKHTSGTETLTTYEGLPAFEYGGPVYDYSLLNSARDDHRREIATYALEDPWTVKLDPPPVREGRELVATFRFDATLDPYALYAAPGSEILAKGVRHYHFATPVLASGRPGSKGWLRVEPEWNAWRLPTDVVFRFELESPVPPTLLFTPKLAPARDGSAAANRPVCVIVRANGIELNSCQIDASTAPWPMHAAAIADAGSEYKFEIECSTGATGAYEPFFVDLRDVLLRAGEPLRAQDFKLSFERARGRIEYVASTGLPYLVGER